MIINMIEQMEVAGDNKTAAKCRQAFEKLDSQTVHIGFCGLFSAGKSTMINALLEKAILPSSPIPTSANVVDIHEGQLGAKITFADGQHTVLDVDQLENWKEYCKDGVDVLKVDISLPHILLQDRVHYLDTPGIDSHDAQHQKATEDALHLADVVVFVTDYHHVQSEFNFKFMKSLKEKGKTLFLVINQIDKHQEDELPAAVFLQKVSDGLLDWGIDLDGMVCTSLKDLQHPMNQIDQLKQNLKKVQVHKHVLIQKHFMHVVETLLGEHKQFLVRQQEQEREQIDEKIEQLKTQCAYDEHPDLLQQYEQSQQRPQNWKKDVEQEAKDIIQNAIITPYTTTRLAESLIESYQENFSMGWFSSKKKRDEERRKRLTLFHEDISEKVTSQIEWHVKEMLRKKAELYQLTDSEFQTKIMDWHLSVPEEWLTNSIKQNISREFTYTYTQDVTQKIGQLYRGQIEALAVEGSEKLAELQIETYEPMQETLGLMRAIQKEEQHIIALDHEVNEVINSYKTSVPDLDHYDAEELLLANKRLAEIDWHISNLDAENIQGTSARQAINSEHVKQTSAATQKRKQPAQIGDHQRFQQMADKLVQAAQMVREIPPLESVVQDLEERAERLRQQRFQICLFGAFSAGKSSFANALLGEPLLPASPHPTTATINYILGPTAEHPSNTALVSMKTTEQIETEIDLSLERLKLTKKGSVAERLKQIQGIQANELRTSLRPYMSFLQACLKGWSVAEPQLGTQLTLDHEAFKEYVAEEQKACFVQDVQLFHESYFSQQGLEIIDTPGADSIYSRHTDVTFDFIKHSDAIIYLTYYNHAFSRADKQFLDQLGQVKDQFALDKMFFVINAADLAESEEELHAVEEHVSAQLLASGIRFPRLHAVSSLQAFQGDEQSGMDKFEQAFDDFFKNELAALQLESAQNEMQRGYDIVRSMQQEMDESAEVRQQKKAELQEKEKQWLDQIDVKATQSNVLEIEKEVQELFYYVRQRLFFAFSDHFQEAFTSSVLTAEKASKQQLHMCLDELLYSLLTQLKNECKATSLRLENFLFRKQERIVNEWRDRTAHERIHLSNKGAQKEHWAVPAVPEPWPKADQKKLETHLRVFKNPKHFFEQGGKKLLQEQLEKELDGMAQAQLSAIMTAFQTYYAQKWSTVEESMNGRLKDEVRLACASRTQALDGVLSAEAMQNWLGKYEQIVQG